MFLLSLFLSIVTNRRTKITQFLCLGESFGGVVAQIFTTEHPSMVDGLVLLSSKAKMVLSPEMKFKLVYLLPILQVFGKL
jgi:pimeloyl-ACP methyl ester carboxylesterase